MCRNLSAAAQLRHRSSVTGTCQSPRISPRVTLAFTSLRCYGTRAGTSTVGYACMLAGKRFGSAGILACAMTWRIRAEAGRLVKCFERRSKAAHDAKSRARLIDGMTACDDFGSPLCLIFGMFFLEVCTQVRCLRRHEKTYHSAKSRLETKGVSPYVHLTVDCCVLNKPVLVCLKQAVPADYQHCLNRVFTSSVLGVFPCSDAVIAISSALICRGKVLSTPIACFCNPAINFLACPMHSLLPILHGKRPHFVLGRRFKI